MIPASEPAPNSTAPATTPDTRTIEDPRALIAGHSVRLLRNGAEAFPIWLAAIEAARERVSLEMYIFSDDVIGRRFAEALVRAAQRGVDVRLLYDYVGCRDTPARFFQRMRSRGIHVVAYHRYRAWRPRLWTLFRRNHRKTLVCDGRVAFTGGLNISDEWAPESDGGGDWHDAAIEINGPAVAPIEASFFRLWNRRARKRSRLDPTRLSPPAPAGDVRLVMIGNDERRERFAIRRAALHALRESQRRVHLVLLAAGVRIWRSTNVVHTKALAVDDIFVSIGSYNFDHRSLTYNLEMVVNVLDTAHATDVVDMIEGDITGSEELTREGFGRRSLLARLLERLVYSFRKWL